MHCKTGKHQKAKAILAETSGTSQTLAAPVNHTPFPAAMVLADRWSGYDSDDVDEDFPSPRLEDPFTGSISYGGEILDSNGDPVIFSAGKVPVDDTANAIWRDIEDLDYLDHTVLADMSRLMERLFDKTDDSTVSDAARAMAAMG